MSKVYIEIIASHMMKRTLFNRFKTSLWNFILPPHVHLLLPKQEEQKESK